MLLRCPAALSHQPGTQCGTWGRVAETLLWAGSLGTHRTLGNLRHSSKPLPCLVSTNPKQPGRADCWVIWHKGSQNQGGSGAALQTPGPWAASGGAVAGTASGGSSAGAAAAAAGWGNVGHGLQRSARKGKGEKENWADTPLKATKQKSRQLWGKKFSIYPWRCRQGCREARAAKGR